MKNIEDLSEAIHTLQVIIKNNEIQYIMSDDGNIIGAFV